MPVKDHLGNTFNTTLEMCHHYNISSSAFHGRYNIKKWSLKDALTTPVRNSKRKKPCKDHKGNDYPSILAMCQAYNLSPPLFYHRQKALNWSLEDCLTTPVDTYKTNGDHKDLKALCQEHGLTLPQYRARLKNPNWTKEDALTQPKSARPHQNVTDHLGNTYPTLTAMCQHYNLRLDTYRNRLKKGFSKEEALTYKLYQTKVITDHKGNPFASRQDMAEHYGIDITTFSHRLKKGMTLEEALTKPLYKNITDPFGNTFTTIKEMAEHYNVSSASVSHYQNNPEKLKRLLTEKRVNPLVEDHKGNVFNGLDEMLKHYDITYSAYRQRIKKLNWSLEKTLTTPVKKRQTAFIDHKGNTYPTLKAMADTYKIPANVLATHLHLKWPIEKALTTPKIIRKKATTDHKGNSYPSVRKMAEAYQIPYATYWHRRKKGWSKEKALTTPVQKKRRRK